MLIEVKENRHYVVIKKLILLCMIIFYIVEKNIFAVIL